MTISFAPMPSGAFPAWVQRSMSSYKADLIVLGTAPDRAREQAKQTLREAFPEGVAAPHNAVFNLTLETGAIVGYVWVGRDRSADPASWWVWDIAVDSEHRGKGFGRAGRNTHGHRAPRQWD